MKPPSLFLLSFLLAPSLFADAGQHLIPAGSLIGCTVSEPKFSSKSAVIGDPVLCQLSHSERFGRSVLPYNSYLVGRFEDYKDPGHFVGKGFMELHFDRMVVEPETVIPIDARVVDAPGYRVDNVGRIIGKGHATRDIVMWSIPILWPIDLLLLPMRGPRPTLKEETRLTLKVMDDLPVPATEAPQSDPSGLMHRQTGAYDSPPPPTQSPRPAPEPTAYMEQAPPPQPAYAYPPTYAYAPAYTYAPVVVAPMVMPMVIAAPPPVVVTYGYGVMPMAPAPAPYGYGGAGWGYPAARYRSYGYGYASAQVPARGRLPGYQMPGY